jgi:diaminopimelate epimerase
VNVSAGLAGMQFRKVHGAGNDFILFTDPVADLDWADSAMALCPRRTGIGADGLVVSTRRGGDPPVYEVRCFNADGSEATMCGNALRCAASCAARDYGDREMSLLMAGVCHKAAVTGDEAAVTAQAGPVTRQRVEFSWQAGRLLFDSVWTGTEHVVAVVTDVDEIDVESCGRLVRYHRTVAPEGTNVNFAEILGPDAVKVRTYERGVEAETLSCGSGAVAVVAVARQRGVVGEGPVTVHNRARAPLTVTPAGEGVFWVCGPTAVVCEGVLL